MRNQVLTVFLTLAAAAPASAAMVEFSGTYSHQNPPAAPDGRCAPTARTVTFGPDIAPASGASNLGGFDPSGSHCINPPLPTNYSDGLFNFDFGFGDLLSGTYSGILSATGDPLVFANVQDYVVTGGTGRFMAASGAFQGIGTVTFAPGALPSSFQSVSGTLNLAAVPEPRSWAMMIGGLALTGAAMRRSKTRVRYA